MAQEELNYISSYSRDPWYRIKTDTVRTRRRPRCDKSHHICTWLLLCFMDVSVLAQQLGVDICACSPSFFQFTFDLSKNCSSNVLIGAGIEKTECSIAPFQATDANSTNSTLSVDLIPTSVSSIDIQELDSSLLPIVQSSKFGTFGTGATFNYTSVVAQASIDGQFNATQVPKALQLAMLGYNADGVAIFFQVLIIYVVNCSAYPVIETGSTIGWITLVETAAPPESVCPRAATNSTTTAPVVSLAPAAPSASLAPTNSISLAPASTIAPSVAMPVAPVLPTSTASPTFTQVPLSVTKVPMAPLTVAPVIVPSSVITSQPRQPTPTIVPGSTKAPAPFRSTKFPTIVRSTKSPFSPIAPDQTDNPSTMPSLPCPTSKGKGMGKGKGGSKHGKGKGKGLWSDKSGKGSINLDPSWSDSLFEKYGIKHECKSKKEKSPKGKGKGKGKSKKSKKKSKKSPKGKGDDDWGYDDYYYEGDDTATMYPSYSPRAVPLKSLPSSKTLRPTASSAKGAWAILTGSPVVSPVADTTQQSNDSQVGTVHISSGSYEAAISHRSFNRTKNTLTIVGAVFGGILCMLGLVLLAKRQYKHHRKIRIEKALNIMKGLERPTQKGSVFRKI